MTGFAKTLFLDKFPCSDRKKNIESGRWTRLKTFLKQNRISFIDYFFTERLLHSYSTAIEETAFFLCHLFLAAKKGHLCIIVNENQIIPDPSFIWLKEDSIPLSDEEVNSLREWILKGSKCIPSHLIHVCDFTKESTEKPLCKYQDHYYLQKHWLFESLFLKHIQLLATSNPRISFEKEVIINSVSALLKTGILLPEQAQAIERVCLYPISIITGGPGTGKTYTASHLINLFWNLLSIEQKSQCKILIAAPTGKAAANLQKAIKKNLSELIDFPELTAKTVHSLLEIKSDIIPFSSFKKRLSGDLIIIDESSMMDAKMMALLFQSLQNGSRVVLLGDPHQLASVEAGSLFADLVNNSNSLISCTELTTCLRTELKSIIDFAALVKQGKSEEVINILNINQFPITRLPFSLKETVSQNLFIKETARYFPCLIKSETDSKELLNLFNNIRLLSPVRKGHFGVDALNKLFWQYFSQGNEKEGWLAIPIMIVANDYGRDLFNGETGTLLRKLPLSTFSVEDYALFPSRTNYEEIRRIPAFFLPKYEYAYCLSVHKSQGSEFDGIICLLPEGSAQFGREILYTAVTRAKKHIQICASDEILHKIIKEQGRRLSGLV